MANGTHHLSRRRFLRGATATGGLLALGGLSGASYAFRHDGVLPPPGQTGIEHIVVLMMENRSFDHMLGWLDGADGRQARPDATLDVVGNAAPHVSAGAGLPGLRPSRSGSFVRGRTRRVQRRRVRRLAARRQQRRVRDRLLRQEGSCLSSPAPRRRWTVCDRYFSAIMAGTFANRIYQHAAQTDRLANTFELSTLPTIWDRLAARRPRRPLLLQRSAVSRAVGQQVRGHRPSGGRVLRRRGRRHAAARLVRRAALPRRGSRRVQRRSSVRRHPQRPGVHESGVLSRDAAARPGRNTVFVINYDEWGGFFDHVPPPTAPIPAGRSGRGQ